VLGDLYLEVALRRPHIKDWPAFWGARQVWHFPDIVQISVGYVALDTWKRKAQYRLIEVNPFFFNEETPEYRDFAGLVANPDHRVHGYWVCCSMDPDGPAYSKNLDALFRRTEVTQDDLDWLFDHWKSSPARNLEWWIDQAERNMPVRGINPDHCKMVLEAAQRALER